MQSPYADRTQVCRPTSIGCSGGARHRSTFTLAALCVCFFALCAQSVFAAIDIYIYKNENGALTFTSVPTQAGLTRVVRSGNKPETNTRSSQANPGNALAQLFRDKESGDIGYLDGETFIPIWPDSYTTFTNDDSAFASPNEYEDIWVAGLSEQVGLIKLRRGLPLDVTVTAIDWLIERNLDKYKPRIPSQPNQLQTKVIIVVFIIALAFFLVIVVTVGYKDLATIPFLIRVAISKYARGNRCRYCQEHTENDTRICNECQIRLESEKAKAGERERQEQEHRTRHDNDSERTAGGNGFDPYRVLRITRGANQEEIKAAYFNLIKQYHPDRVSHLGQEFQKLAEEKAKLINRAYQLLVEKPGYAMIETR